MEKKAIIEELFKTHLYLDENADMKIETLHDYDNIPETCPKCNESLEEIYSRPEGNISYDLVVSECKKCKVCYAFLVEDATDDDTFLVPAKEDEHIGDRVVEPHDWKHVGKPQWGEGKQPKFSKEIAKEYEKSPSKTQTISNKLDTIIQTKLPEMYKAGLSIETINSARNKVMKYLRENSATSRQLVKLFAAAVYDASNEELAGIGGLKRIGEKVSERELEKIFQITRKTIREWRKRLSCRMNPSYDGVILKHFQE